MLIYLDTSVLKRPFDEQVQPRVWLETQACVLILQLVEGKKADLVSSTVLEYENSRNPVLQRRQWMDRCLCLARHTQKLDSGVRKRAQHLEDRGLQAIDALHLACAEAAGSEYFLTCDDQVLRRYQGQPTVLNPVGFVLSVTGERP